MTFSQKCKEEMAEVTIKSRHCTIAQLAAIIRYSCVINHVREDIYELSTTTSNDIIIKKLFTLLRKAFNIDYTLLESATMIRTNSSGRITLTDSDIILSILSSVKLLPQKSVPLIIEEPICGLITKNSCCKKAYINMVFLCIGTVNNPNKGYHLELTFQREYDATHFSNMLKELQIESKVTIRKYAYVVYIKEASAISDFLNICGAHLTMMDFENERILREMRNNVNRAVNCDSANISKTITAASKQLNAINTLMEIGEYDKLPDNLKEMAEIRLNNPEASLEELSELINPPISRSGANHRLRKIISIANSRS